MTEFLFDLARNNANVLECATSDAKSNHAKQSCWEGISALFNARFPAQPINHRQASEKWRSHKKEVKSAAAKQRVSIMTTGNVFPVDKMEDAHEKTFSIIKDTINPIK